MSPKYERAILVFIKASNLQGEILELSNQSKKANQIYIQSRDLLKILQERSYSEQSTTISRLSDQLQRSIYRTQLQMKINNIKTKMPIRDISTLRGTTQGSPLARGAQNLTYSRSHLSNYKSPYRHRNDSSNNKTTTQSTNKNEHLSSSRTFDRSSNMERILSQNRYTNDYQHSSPKEAINIQSTDKIHFNPKICSS